MRTSFVTRKESNAVLHSSAGLAAAWRKMSAATPARHTAEALKLLTTTAESSGGDGSAEVAALLAERETSALLWKTLRRQRVPWEAALSLAAPQLGCLPERQAAFVRALAKGRPWSFSRAVLASWDMPDPSLSPVYRDLKDCTTVVAASQQVTAALRSRPELGQVLPITVAVLRHLYALGTQECLAGPSGTTSSSSGSAGGDSAAALALRLCGHIALIGADTLTTRDKEELALAYARLHARAGDWAAALAVVTSSAVVRLSEKAAYSAYVKSREMFRGGERLTPKLVPDAISAAPGWPDALQLLRRHMDMEEAKAAFLSRADVLATAREATEDGSAVVASHSAEPPDGPLTWRWLLQLFGSIPGRGQSYKVLHPILECVPTGTSEYIVMCAAALAPTAARMYAGTFTRRLHGLRKKGRVAEAVALCCAGGYYDLAASLLPDLVSVSAPERCASTDAAAAAVLAHGSQLAYELPAELLLYNKTVAFLRQPQREGVGRDAPPPNGTASDLRPAGLPELLAHALHGDWRAVAASGADALTKVDRLRSLLSAYGGSAAATGEAFAEPNCYSFTSAETSQLVCGRASSKNQQYFKKVIPPPLRAHHFGGDAVPAGAAGCGGAGGASSPSADVDAFLQFLHAAPGAEQVVVTAMDCDRLLQGIARHIRKRKHGDTDDAGRGVALLRAVARACATGRVQPRTSDAFSLALATLTGSMFLRVSSSEVGTRLDALAATAAFHSIPSLYLDPCAPAMAAGTNALFLSGGVRVVSAVYRRWRRKEKEGTEEITAVVAPSSGDGQHLADVFARGACHLPRESALKWVRELWRDYRRPSALLLQELLVDDTRQTADLLSAQSKRKAGRGKALRDSHHHHPHPYPRLSTSARRRLMGMAFGVLDTTPALRFLVQAAGRERITAEDIDEHGFQRLVRVLPGPTALAAVEQLCANGETVEELWLLLILCKPDHHHDDACPAELTRRVTALAPHSLLVNCHCTVLTAVAVSDPLLALKAVLRFVELALSAYAHSAPALYGVLAVMLRQFSESPAMAAALLNGINNSFTVSDDDGSSSATGASEARDLSHRILNLLLKRRDLENLLLSERREMALLLRSPSGASPVLLLGWLHHALAHRLRLPVAAAFTSRLLLLTADSTADWMAALHFFGWLRRPTDEERLALLRALRHCSRDLTARLQHTPRLLLASPELVLLWSDASAVTFQDKLRLSEAVIEGRGARDGPALSPQTAVIVRQWAVKDCSRALGIFRRMGLLVETGVTDSGDVAYQLVGDDPAMQSAFETVRQQQQQGSAGQAQATGPAPGPVTP